MTNEQLNTLALEHIFGLRLVTGADVPQPHIGPNGPQEAWVDAQGKQVYCKWCGNVPDLVGNEVHVLMIRKRMRELGFWYSLRIESSGSTIVKFYGQEGSTGHEVPTDELEPLATVTAALKALGVDAGGVQP